MTGQDTAVGFATWQFVRIMVRLEESAARDPARKRLLAAWQDDWSTLDRDLEALRQEDFEAFADLMMNHEVSFDSVPAADLGVLCDIAGEVADQLAAAGKSEPKAMREDLTREAEEMRALAADLRAAQTPSTE